jgi:hypothetical protein
MNIIKNILLMFLLTALLVSCSNQFNDRIGGCPDGAIEWVDVLMINNIKYEHDFPEPTKEKKRLLIVTGKQIGQVSYKMADHACSNHKMKNGDAAYQEIGTKIYELKGYPVNLAVVANGNVYIANQNKRAKTAGELFPMVGLVKNIYIESPDDGRRLHTFSPSSKEEFLKAFYPLKLVDADTLDGSMEGKQVFLEIELNNGVSFRQVYWLHSNTFYFGAVGNNEIKEIIQKELANI